MRKKFSAKRCASAALAIVLAAAGMTVSAKPEEVYAAETVNEKETAGDENNSRATAEELPADTTMLGKIVYGEDENESDYYKFTFKGKGYYTFELENYELTTEMGDGWIMTIYDENMNEFLSYRAKEGENVESRKIAYKEGTVFYIIIKDKYGKDSLYNTNEAVYGLTAKYTEDKSWESESNGTTAVANVLENGKINGTMVKEDDIDYYKYTAKDTGYIKAYVENTWGDVDNVEDGWLFDTYDKDMNVLKEADAFTTVSDPCYCIVKKGQVLYFKVSSKAYNNDFYSPLDVQYTLNVSFTKTVSVEKEKNDTFDKTNTVKKSIYGVRGSEENKLDVDGFKFIAKKTGKTKIKIEVDDLKYSWKVVVYDSNKKLVSTKEISSNDTVTVKTVKGKKYYVGIKNNSNYDTSSSYSYLYKVTIK